MDLLDCFLAQHAQSHAAAMSDAGEPLLTDQLLAGLTEEELRLRLTPNVNSIAWLLWHLARSEDVMVNVLLTDGPQVLDSGTWLPQLYLTQRDMGTGMTSAGVSSISREVAIAPLHAYRIAVGRRTREVVSALRASDWDGPVDPDRLLAAGAFSDTADGAKRVRGYWQGKTRSDVLGSSLTTHNYQHLGEATCIKSLIKAR